MAKDKLFMSKPDFFDGEKGPFYCPDCMATEGLLSWYPRLRDEIDVVYVDFPKPRPEIVAEIGVENQSTPVLVLAKNPEKTVPYFHVREYNGKWFISGDQDVRGYLTYTYKIARSH